VAVLVEHDGFLAPGDVLAPSPAPSPAPGGPNFCQGCGLETLPGYRLCYYCEELARYTDACRAEEIADELERRLALGIPGVRNFLKDHWFEVRIVSLLFAIGLLIVAGTLG
jgi:hypothetical protein